MGKVQTSFMLIRALESLAGRLAAAFDRRHRLVLLLLAIAWFTATAAAAAKRPFWHDEIYTILLAGLPAPGLIWSAVRDGADLAAPLNTLLTYGVHAMLGEGHVWTRLPALIGAVLMLASVFTFVRVRAGTSLAVAAGVLLTWTAAYRYSSEARGYGLMLGMFALALLAWAEAAAGRRRTLHLPLLVVAVAGATWSHYFGLFALAPIGVGEAVRTVGRRRLDGPMWIAVATSLLLLAPLFLVVRGTLPQTSTFWSRAAFAETVATYTFVLHDLGAGVVLAAVLVGVVTALLVRAMVPVTRVFSLSSVPRHEVAAIATCLLLPVLEIGAAVLTTGVFAPRYALPTAIGAGLGMPLLLSRLAAGRALGPVLFALVLAVPFGQTVVQSVRTPPFVSPLTSRPLLHQTLDRPAAVAVTGGLVFLQLWYYATPDARPRLVYLADPDAAVTHTGSDTIDRGLLALAAWTPISVADYRRFTVDRPEFLVYTAGSGWLLAQLERDGAVVEARGTDAGARLLLVRLQP